jgi:hypothetical protein
LRERKKKVEMDTVERGAMRNGTDKEVREGRPGGVGDVEKAGAGAGGNGDGYANGNAEGEDMMGKFLSTTYHPPPPRFRSRLTTRQAIHLQDRKSCLR